MKDINFIATLLNASFEELAENNEQIFKDEYDVLSESESDLVGQWLKNAQARGDTSESDQVLLTLLVELHKKVDRLESIIKNEQIDHLELKNNVKLIGINFDYIQIDAHILEIGKNYYMRIPMPIFPKREIPVFLTATSTNTAKVSLISQKNQLDWNAYITAREREIIRETKRNIS